MNHFMNISDIMCTDVASLGIDSSLQEVVLLMQSKEISSVVVCKDDTPVGIITERDIARAALSPEESLTKAASEVMAAPVCTVQKDADYRDAYMTMVERGIRHLVVVDEQNTLLGILDEGDFLRHLSPEQLLAIKEIEKVMSKLVLTCSPDETVAYALKLMNKKRVSTLVIQKEGKPVGILSERDTLKLIQLPNSVLQTAVKEFMSSPVITIHYKQTVLNAQSVMADKRVRRLIVVDSEGNTKGIITRHDLIKNLPNYYIELLREMVENQKQLVTKTKKQLDEKLFFQNAMQALPHSLVFAADKEGYVQFVNIKKNESCEIPDVKIGDNLSTLSDTLFELLQDSKWQEKLALKYTLNKIIEIENTGTHPLCYFQTSISEIYNSENTLEGYIFIAKDISTSEHLKKELRNTSEKLENAYHIAKIGNWQLDANTMDAVWSDEICDILGIQRGTVGGPKILSQFVKDKDFSKISNSLASAIEYATEHEVIYEITRPNDKQTRWVECRAKREIDKDGNTQALLGTLQDITQRVKSEKSIQHLNSLLKSIRTINQLIIKERSPERLLQKICDEITHVRNFYGAWILLHSNQKNEFYSSGFKESEISKMKQNLNSHILPECCSDTSSGVKIYENTKMQCIECPLSTASKEQIAITAPIIFNGIHFGHLGLSVPLESVQNNEEKQLIKELSDDIAFSLNAIAQNEIYEKTQRRYRSLVDNSQDGIFIHTLEGVLLDVNPALELLHGRPKEEIIGHNVIEFYKPENLPLAALHFEEIQKTGHIMLDMELLKLDGTPFHAELVASLVEIDGENVVQGSIRDVTQRYEAEKKAKESEDTMILALESAGHGVWEYNIKTNEILFSHHYKSMLGYTDEELDNSLDTFLELVHPDDLKYTQFSVERFIQQNKKSLRLTFRLRCKDGTYKWILSIATKVIYEGERAVKITGTNTDISEQKEEEEKFKRIFKDSPTGIIYYTSEGILLDCNDKFAKLFHTEPEKLIGINIFDTIKNENFIQAFQSSIETGHGEYEGWYEASTTTAIGYGHAIFHGIKDADGKIRNGIGLVSEYTKLKETESSLRLFKRGVEASTEGIVITKADGNQDAVYVNPAFERLTGYTSREILGKELSFLQDTTQNENELLSLHDALEKGISKTVFLNNLKKDGTRFISRLSMDPIFDENNKLSHFVGFQKDITKLKEDEKRLRQSAAVFENTSEGVMITDAQVYIIDVNDAFTSITGRTKEEAIHQKPSILKSGRHDKAFYQGMWKSITDTGQWCGEIWNRRKNGEIYPQWLNISSVKNSLGEIENYIAVFSDITTLKESEEKLDYMAHHDHLTELPNRILLKARLQHTLSINKRQKLLTAVMFMDLDNFKNINDSYGHSVGDEVLVAVSSRILSTLREDDTLARIGGDEFVIVMDNFKTTDDINRVAQNIIDTFEKPYYIGEREFWITSSIGISISPEDGTSAETLIKNADTAMYEAKSDGKNMFKYYNDNMTAKSFERMLFENALKTAVINNEFEVYYQPQENIQTDTIIGFEALLRWNHPSLGIVTPRSFHTHCRRDKDDSFYW
ncbi:PAS domain S-box protein [bacterium]|nr:PAS domain S-box protein [bacterium]MBU1990402.1 PAS domain S-box protein [bacterium]